MYRRIAALLWLTSAFAPSIVSFILAFGCCVLPFHKSVHRVMPACHVAMQLASPVKDEDESTPAEPRDDRAQRFAAAASPRLRFVPVTMAAMNVTSSLSPTFMRSSFSPGAARCDSDVGLTELLATWRI
jgi:hypothetical protein